MTTIEEFLSNLSDRNITLWLDNNRLRYRASKENLTLEILTELKARKQEILNYLSSKQTLSNLIKPISRDEIIPLSFTQQRLWFLNQLEENKAIYNLSSQLKLEGNINIDALEKAFFTIIERHENLRTCFHSKNGIPYQVISAKIDFNLPLIDLTNLSLNEQNQEIENIAKKEKLTPFDFTKTPLIRIKLVRLSSTNHILIITIHHIISDGWSSGIIKRELSILYQAYINNKSNPLPPLSIQFADFAYWQKKYLQGEVLNHHLNYWQKQLKNVPSLLEIPLDFPRPPQQSYQGNRIKIEISAPLTNQLKKLSKKLKVTLFMVMFTAFATLLYRYSHQKDFVIGTPIANRTLVEIEPLIGFFANTLALRIHGEDNIKFTELLQQVKTTTLSAYTHQEIPFEKLVEVLQIERSLSYNPLFQVMFAWQNMPKEKLNFDELTITPLKKENNITQFDLDFTLTENNHDSIHGYITYNIDLFCYERISKMVGHFYTLLEAIVKNPEEEISRLSLLTEEEKNHILFNSNNAQNKLNIEKSVHQLFEAQAENTPNKIAVICEEEKLTYQELNEKANQLAHYLQKSGVQNGTLIGIFVEKSLSMIIALLGILKVGATYIPLNINYPEKRLTFMLENTQISLLLTQQKLINKLPSNQAKKICLDEDWHIIKNSPKNNLITNNNLDDLAYIIYTSGSTGKPKGVMISQEALVNFTHTVIHEYPIKKEDRILQFASLSFDTAAEEIYPCLCNGATLIIRTDKWLTSITSFLKYCQEYHITILDLPTAYWSQIMADLDHYNWSFPTSIRLIIIGGEKAPLQSVKIWQKKVGNYPQLMNTYGPTENTIVSTKYILKTNNIDGKLPIGKPLSYVETYVLDNHFQIVPMGVDGELYLGGKGLAKGYFNQPELTEQKFIDYPFQEINNNNIKQKLYKTGDLVRYGFDGNLEFQGRVDNQVKIRGFRIELGEIETIIMQHSNVKQALVISTSKNEQYQFLVAYIVSKNKQDNFEDLKHFLKEKLPHYMIPSLFILINSFSLTSNGKIDYKKLPLPDFNQVYKTNKSIAPRNELERQLKEIWLKTLELNDVSINDNFFTVGGHSLLAVKLMSEIERQLDVNLPISMVFKAGNIAEMAEEINQMKTSIKSAQQSSSLVLIKQGKSALNPLFLIHPIGGEIFCYNDLISSLKTENSCYGLTRINEEKTPQYQSIEELAKTYLKEIKKIGKHQYILGGWSYGGLIAFEIAQQICQENNSKNIELLFLIEPTIPKSIKPLNNHLLLQDFLKNITLNNVININWESLKNLPISEQIAIALKQLKENDILPQEYSLNLFKEKLEIFKHDVASISNYQVKTLNQDILLFKSQNYPESAVKFWQNQIQGNLTIYEIPGNHFTMMTQSNVSVLTDNLQFKYYRKGLVLSF